MSRLDEIPIDTARHGEPEWRSRMRREAGEVFAAGTMPSPRHEQWRYVDLDFDLHELPLADGGAEVEDDALAAALGAAETVQVVDGMVTVQGGERLRSLAAVLADGDDAARAASVAATPAHLDLFAAAHTAFGSDGAILVLGKGETAQAPFLVDAVSTAPGVSFPAVWVELAEGSSASLLVHLRSIGAAEATVVPQLAVHLGPNARLRLTVVQNLSYSDRSISHARVVAERDAAIELFEVGLGADLGRLHLTADLAGDGSTAAILGAYFGEESQTLDYRYFMNHIGRNTRSEMFLKGAVEDEAVSVFTGMIRIEETGQKTEAFQTNRNLLLSEGATAQSVPNLEILANDVKCGHASSVGPLDDGQRYYLMSRGLDRERADRLQVRGFFEEVLARLPQQSVAPVVREWINRKYVLAQQEGRV